MKQTIIPAQITTVEDKIAGGFSFTQILLLLFPVFFGLLVFAYLPAPMKLNNTKLVLFLTCFIVCVILTIRISDRLVLSWLNLIIKFHLRPKNFVFNKNDNSYREVINDYPISLENPIKFPTLKMNYNFKVNFLPSRKITNAFQINKSKAYVEAK